MKQPSPNVHADKLHVMPSGRAVIGVSHSWAKEVDRALNAILDASPDLRHVAIQVPKAEGDVRRLFHSADGLTWRQVHLREFGARRFDIAAIVRGAKELDGEEYRAKWGLKPDYPMVAPTYAAKRQELAKKIGLGRKPRAPEPAAAPKGRSKKKAVA